MDKLQKNSLTIIVSVVASVILVWGFGLGGKNIETVTKEVVKEVKETGQSLGALSGPDIPFDYLGWGGVRTYSQAMDMRVATATVCAIQSPAATSTLVNGPVARFELASTSAVTLWVAKAATAFASTTVITTYSLGASAQATVMASSSPTMTVVDSTFVFAPNTWLTVGMTGAIKGGSDTGQTGTRGECQAQFIAI